jgi:hypothetical protein
MSYFKTKHLLSKLLLIILAPVYFCKADVDVVSNHLNFVPNSGSSGEDAYSILRFSLHESDSWSIVTGQTFAIDNTYSAGNYANTNNAGDGEITFYFSRQASSLPAQWLNGYKWYNTNGESVTYSRSIANLAQYNDINKMNFAMAGDLTFQYEDQEYVCYGVGLMQTTYIPFAGNAWVILSNNNDDSFNIAGMTAGNGANLNCTIEDTQEDAILLVTSDWLNYKFYFSIQNTESAN